MNRTVGAGLALVLATGLAASAQAAGTNAQNGTTAPNQPAAMTQPAQPRMATSQRLSQKQLRQARLNRTAHLRVATSHKQHMTHTANLHRKNLPANPAVGVGSSTPAAGISGSPQILRGTGSNSAGSNEATTPNMNQ